MTIKNVTQSKISLAISSSSQRVNWPEPNNNNKKEREEESGEFFRKEVSWQCKYIVG